jgi:hypothetical protein
VTGMHRRSTPLIRLLARLGWQRDPDGWSVPCRDVDGRRARLLIGLSPAGVTITPTAPGPLRLTALQVGRLRQAARDAIQTGGLLTDPDYAEAKQRSWRAAAPTAPPDGLLVQREVIHFTSPATRPTVWELRDTCQRWSEPTCPGPHRTPLAVPRLRRGAGILVQSCA